MNKNIVFSCENVLDQIELDSIKLNGYISIGIEKQGDFYVELYFINNTIQEFKELIEISKKNHALKISSFILKEYPIKYIVITDFSSSNENLSVRLKCLSDDPEIYKNILVS